MLNQISIILFVAIFITFRFHSRRLSACNNASSGNFKKQGHKNGTKNGKLLIMQTLAYTHTHTHEHKLAIAVTMWSGHCPQLEPLRPPLASIPAGHPPQKPPTTHHPFHLPYFAVLFRAILRRQRPFKRH